MWLCGVKLFERNEMNKIKLILPALFFLGIFSTATGAKTVMVDRIVAVVNDEIITMADLERFKDLLYMDAAQKPSGPQANMQLLNQMIEKKLILQEAKVMKIEVSETRLQNAINDVVARSNTTLEGFKELLEKSGVSFEEYRDLLKSELIQSQVISQKVQAKINITDQDVESYYKEKIQPDEKPGARVRIQQILLKVPKEAGEEEVSAIEKKAAELNKRLKAGESFGKTAMAFSQGPAAQAGGDLGYFHRGEILPEIEKAAFSMEAGEVSPVIRTIVGFHIIKLIDKDLTEKDRSWRDHEREIKNTLFSRRYEKTFKDWMEGLRNKAYIKVNY